MDYAEFLDRKSQLGGQHGFAPVFMPDFLFDFQKHLVDWACRKGRAAIFADCGLGKTPAQLVWAENVVRHANGRVLILTPLAVAQQTIREAQKFGIDAALSRDGTLGPVRIVVTNYEKLHLFRPEDFCGCVCDESSILKSFDGVRRSEITDFMRKLPYRLLCTATAAPNDFTELGTSSEALGELGHVDMLDRFFKNDQNTIDQRKKWRLQSGADGGHWRFKGHAEIPFWRWVCSWARGCRRPSDLGFEDARFVLPNLIETEHRVRNTAPAPGMLFTVPAVGLFEQRQERKRTIQERCEMAAKIVAAHKRPAVVWCHLNAEGDLLAEMIPDCEQISGSDSEEEKERKLSSFATGELICLVIKPKIGAWGLNWQHCSDVVTFASHSYEQYYQSVRRCWRFGQKRAVTVNLICTDGEVDVVKNLRRKAQNADRMFSSLVTEMNRAIAIRSAGCGDKKEEVPTWLS